MKKEVLAGTDHVENDQPSDSKGLDILMRISLDLTPCCEMAMK